MRAPESGQVSLEPTRPTDGQADPFKKGPAGKNQPGLIGHCHSNITRAPGNLLEALMPPDGEETKPK